MGLIVFTYVLIVVSEPFLTLLKHASRSGLFETLKMFYCADGWMCGWVDGNHLFIRLIFYFEIC